MAAIWSEGTVERQEFLLRLFFILSKFFNFASINADFNLSSLDFFVPIPVKYRQQNSLEISSSILYSLNKISDNFEQSAPSNLKTIFVTSWQSLPKISKPASSKSFLNFLIFEIKLSISFCLLVKPRN